MARPIDILNKVKTIHESTTVTLSPGPIEIRCNWKDARAMGILETLEDLTTGDAIDVLLSALWWSDMFSAQPKARAKDEEG